MVWICSYIRKYKKWPKVPLAADKQTYLKITVKYNLLYIKIFQGSYYTCSEHFKGIYFNILSVFIPLHLEEFNYLPHTQLHIYNV